MSLGVYAKEPATNGKVILKTSMGDVDVELWPKEAPKACRNFVQLCLEGYYDNTIFHRIVKDFIVQGGDATGTGFGGECIYPGNSFQDEFHSRLKYRYRGMVGMANTGRNANRSQFFFTLGPTPELEGKNTIFGKVTGNTIFNVLKMGELEVNEQERPLYPPYVISAEVIANPFDDIIPRDLYALGIKQKPRADEDQDGKPTIERPQIRKKRNVALLSFGEEEAAAEDERPAVRPKMKSSHTLEAPAAGPEEVAAKADSKTMVEPSVTSTPSRHQDKDQTKESHPENERQLSEKRRRIEEKDHEAESKEKDRDTRADKSQKREKSKIVIPEDENKDTDGLEKPMSAYDQVMTRRQREKEKRDQEFKELKKSLLSFKKQAENAKTEEADKKKDNTLSPLEEMRLKYKEKTKKRSGDRQKQALEALKQFQQSLKQPDKEWKQHVLKFEKIGGEMSKEEDLYSVFDPLLGKDKKSKPSWHKQRLQPKKETEKW